MPDQIESYKVICNGGLDTTENHLALADQNSGAATRLVNYEVSLFGGYRRVEGYVKYTKSNHNGQYSEVGVSSTQASGTLAEGKVLGVALYKNLTTNADIVITARKDVGSATYSFYYYGANGWVKYVTPTRNMSDGVNTVSKLRHVMYNFGSGNEIVFVDGVNFAIAFDGTNWNEIKTTNASTTVSYGGAQTLDKPSLVGVFENTIFLAGDRTAVPTIAYSSPLKSYDWTSASGSGQLAMGFPVVQIKPFRDNLFVFGENEIKKVSPDITYQFVQDNVTANVGCIATDSVLEIGGDLVFLAPDGVRPVSGTSRIGDVELETISKSVQSMASTLNAAFDLDNLNGVVIRGKSQLRYFIGDDSSPVTSSFGVIGGLRTADQRLGWEFGELLGIRASCCTSGYITENNRHVEIVLHGDYDGHLYRQEQSELGAETHSFNGNNILSVYSTPYLDFGDTEIQKVLRKLNTFIRAEGPLTLGITCDYDWGDSTVARPDDYTATSSGAPVRYRGQGIIYGGTNIIYGGSEKPVFITSLQGSGYAVRTTYVTQGTFAPYSIQGLVYEFSISGRR